MEPQVRYVKAEDGVSIAYWAIGEGPVFIQAPLIPFSHSQMEWQTTPMRRWYERVAETMTLVRYDGRGTGLSQRDVADVSLEAHVRDLAAVVGAVGPRPVALMGVFHSGPAAIAFAARNPEMVSHLVLWCTYASAAAYWKVAQSEGLRALRQTDYMMFLRTGSHELIGWADDGEAERYAQVMRRAVEPDVADRLLDATRDFEVTEDARRVACPSLVVHRRDLDWVGIELSRDLASTLPEAGLVVIDGRSPLPGAGDIEGPARAIADFMGVPVSGAKARSERSGMRAVLFTDLVDHTRMMASLGDHRGRQVLRELERITRQVLSDNDGTEVKALGDGFMASFAAVSKAVACAVELQRRMVSHNAAVDEAERLSVRIGLNAGEPVEEDGDLFGAAVIIASRIAGAAGGGEILVSNSVRELSAGKGFSFLDRGAFTPRGFDESIQIWRVDW